MPTFKCDILCDFQTLFVLLASLAMLNETFSMIFKLLLLLQIPSQIVISHWILAHKHRPLKWIVSPFINLLARSLSSSLVMSPTKPISS